MPVVLSHAVPALWKSANLYLIYNFRAVGNPVGFLPHLNATTCWCYAGVKNCFRQMFSKISDKYPNLVEVVTIVVAAWSPKLPEDYPAAVASSEVTTGSPWRGPVSLMLCPFQRSTPSAILARFHRSAPVVAKVSGPKSPKPQHNWQCHNFFQYTYACCQFLASVVMLQIEKKEIQFNSMIILEIRRKHRPCGIKI